MKLFQKGILPVLFIVFSVSESFRVLGVFPTTWKSHWTIGTSILKQLSSAGHDVTLVSPFELKTENMRNVILRGQPTKLVKPFDLENVSPILNFIVLPQMLEELLEFTFSHPSFQSLLSEKFDVVIVETFHSEALMGLGSHFSCPVIGVTTFGMSSYANALTATPYPTSYVPNLFLKFTDRMSFYERLYNAIFWKIDEFYLYWDHYPRQKKLYKKYFPNAEPFDKQLKNLALLLNNVHFSSYTVRPEMPNVIEIGGIHVEPAKPLPREFQDFLDSAENGVILFSMGSIIQGKDWESSKREAFVRAFGKLKQKVLWKYENETLPNKPSNVMISSWIPQRDILAHPNVKLFITHGGLLGTSEALVEGVPVLGIPIFGDQKMNMNVAASKKYASVLDFSSITEESVTKALKKILSDDEISLKAQEMSKIYNDRPMTPQKSAVYWTEYVVKYSGSSHMLPAGLDLNYLELNSIDVYAFIFSVIVTFVIIIRISVKFTLKKLIKAKKIKTR